MEFDDTIKKISEILINIGIAADINAEFKSDVFVAKTNRYQIILEKQTLGMMKISICTESGVKSFYTFFLIIDGEDKIYFKTLEYLIDDNIKVAEGIYFWLNKILIDIL